LRFKKNLDQKVNKEHKRKGEKKC